MTCKFYNRFEYVLWIDHRNLIHLIIVKGSTITVAYFGHNGLR